MNVARDEAQRHGIFFSVSTSVFLTEMFTPADVKTEVTAFKAASRLASAPLQRVHVSRSRNRKSISTVFAVILCFIFVMSTTPLFEVRLIANLRKGRRRETKKDAKKYDGAAARRSADGIQSFSSASRSFSEVKTSEKSDSTRTGSLGSLISAPGQFRTRSRLTEHLCLVN